MRAEDQRGSGAVRGQRADELAWRLSRRSASSAMRASSGSAYCSSQSSSARAQSAEHAQLRKVDVRVDEAGQQKPPRRSVTGTLGMSRAHRGVVAAGE